MNNLKEKINSILSLLSLEQLKKEILEVKNTLENQEIINFMEEIGGEKL
ncbi:hypothetical protein [Arenibacter aquaticus]|nr:hypothetical protein [Arenibacter aquaticus]